EVHDYRAGAGQADRLAVGGVEGLRGRRGDVPRTGAQPDPDPGGAGVLPAGLLREDREPLAGPGPAGPAGTEALPAPRHDPDHAAPRRAPGLAGRDPRRRGHAAAAGGGAAAEGGAARRATGGGGAAGTAAGAVPSAEAARSAAEAARGAGAGDAGRFRAGFRAEWRVPAGGEGVSER